MMREGMDIELRNMSIHAGLRLAYGLPQQAERWAGRRTRPSFRDWSNRGTPEDVKGWPISDVEPEVVRPRFHAEYRSTAVEG